MNQKAYIKAVCKKIKCTGKKKKELAKQLESDITSALEQGETMEQICARMGTPKELAAEFNENMSEQELKSAKRNKIIKIVGIIVAVLLVLILLGYWMLPKTTPLEDSTTFDSEQVEISAVAVVMALNAEDYDALQKNYAAEIMKPYLTEEYMEQTKAKFNIDWKGAVSFGNAYMVEVSQQGKTYALVQLVVGYGQDNVTYTISFDEDYKLIGLYMK